MKTVSYEKNSLVFNKHILTEIGLKIEKFELKKLI